MSIFTVSVLHTDSASAFNCESEKKVSTWEIRSKHWSFFNSCIVLKTQSSI